MKVIIDSGFPPLDDIRCIIMHKKLYEKKRKYAYKQYIDPDTGYCGTVYFYFPRMNPFSFIYHYIKFYIIDKLRGNEDERTGESEETKA